MEYQKKKAGYSQTLPFCPLFKTIANPIDNRSGDSLLAGISGNDACLDRIA
jgi:hypothetical protein